VGVMDPGGQICDPRREGSRVSISPKLRSLPVPGTVRHSWRALVTLLYRGRERVRETLWCPQLTLSCSVAMEFSSSSSLLCSRSRLFLSMLSSICFWDRLRRFSTAAATSAEGLSHLSTRTSESVGQTTPPSLTDLDILVILW
jgi:hypothetical protein